MAGFRPRPGVPFPAEPLTRAEMLALWEACSGRGIGVMRDRALIAVLWRGGLRIGEALALRPHDIDLHSGRLHVLHGKGDRQRIVGLDDTTCQIVAAWLLARQERLGIGLDKPVFCTFQRPEPGRRLLASTWRDRLRILARRAGIHRRVHPHALRHTHAFELMLEGVPLKIIQKQLGHAHLATTDQYIDHLTALDVVVAIRGRAWPIAA